VSPGAPGPGDEPPDDAILGDIPLPMSRRRKRPAPEGEIDVYGVDEQTDHEVDLGRWVELARCVLHAEGVRGESELSLLFVDEGVMTELNKRFMDGDGPTDVLAFPIDDPIDGGRWPDSGSTGPDREPPEVNDLPTLLGDVVICPSIAARQAPEHAGSYDDELALLVVHGILHVLGHDHADPEEQAAMQAKERDLLARFHQPR
jgi:probable rRNA maturation factor